RRHLERRPRHRGREATARRPAADRRQRGRHGVLTSLAPDALQHAARSAEWCSAEPGPRATRTAHGSRFCGAPLRAAPRPGHEVQIGLVSRAKSRETFMDQPNPNFAGDYDTLLELVKSRASVRKLKPDPIPDEYVTQILEVGRWAMSGANG